MSFKIFADIEKGIEELRRILATSHEERRHQLLNHIANLNLVK